MQVEDVRRIEAEHALWRAGSIRHLLDDHQIEHLYDPYRAWEARRMGEPKIGIHQLFLGECGRQVGKTYGFSTIRVEDGLHERFANKIIMTGAATEIALKELVIPSINAIIASAPDDVRPKFFTSRWGMRAGYHFPGSDAVIKLVGFEDPDSLRGTGLAGCNISEASFIPKLAYAVNSIILPMFSRTPEATIILESSTVRDPNHPFERVFKPDAQRRKAYAFMTLWDNKALSEDTKKSLYEASAAINADEAAREYECKVTRDRSIVLVPTFDKKRHVKAFERPEHALAIMAQDDGIADLYFAGWAFWDARRAKLCVEHEFYGRNTTTSTVADEMRGIERGLYLAAAGIHKKRFILGTPKEERERVLRVLSGEEPGHVSEGFGIVKPDGFCWWDGEEFQPNPALRVSDTSARLIGDLNYEHGIPMVATDKDDAEAASYALRDAFKLDKIEIHPRCVGLIRHLEVGHWNKNRTDWARYIEEPEATLYGHFDGVAMLIYMWRMVQSFRSVDPYPPKFVDRNDPSVMFLPESWKEPQYSALEDFFA